jgi:hypothetical protein
MRIVLRVALASLLSIGLSSVAEADNSQKRRGNIFKHDYTAAYTVQRISVRTSCFPSKLKAILAHIAVHTGKRPVVPPATAHAPVGRSIATATPPISASRVCPRRRFWRSLPAPQVSAASADIAMD